jgi:putative mycofactocin binding protein MftB
VWRVLKSEHIYNMTSTDNMLDEAWALSPAVALRPEPFGAMAYHFGNRKLTFLKTPGLVKVLRLLGDSGNVREAFEAADINSKQWPTYLAALGSLAATDMIRAGEGNNTDE